MKHRNGYDATRRQFLVSTGAVAGGLGLAGLLAVPEGQATPASMAAAIRAIVGEGKARLGKVKLDLPPLVENGNTVSLTVTVESPMTPESYVQSVHIFNEKNPQPNVGNFYFSPRAGRAQVSTRIRLADTQNVVAIARMNDGSLWSGSASVVVTLAACVEEIN